MKPIPLTAIAVATLGFLATLPVAAPAQAEPNPSDRFFCGKVRTAAGGELPATIARTQRGNVTMIQWKSTFFANGTSSFTPEARCEEVSRRFQTFYKNGTLSYLTTGKLNNQNIICVAAEYGGGCKGLLLTLEPQDNPQQVLRDLMDLRVRSRGPITRGHTDTYIDVEEFLDNAPLQGETVSTSPQS